MSCYHCIQSFIVECFGSVYSSIFPPIHSSLFIKQSHPLHSHPHGSPICLSIHPPIFSSIYPFIPPPTTSPIHPTLFSSSQIHQTTHPSLTHSPSIHPSLPTNPFIHPFTNPIAYQTWMNAAYRKICVMDTVPTLRGLTSATALKVMCGVLMDITAKVCVCVFFYVYVWVCVCVCFFVYEIDFMSVNIFVSVGVPVCFCDVYVFM